MCPALPRQYLAFVNKQVHGWTGSCWDKNNGGIHVTVASVVTLFQPVLIGAPRLVLLRFREVGGSPKVSRAESGGRCDPGLCVPRLGLALRAPLPAGLRPRAGPLALGQLDAGAAGAGAEPSLAGARLLPRRLRPPAGPFLPGCSEPSVRLSKGQGIFLPNPPKTQPALEGFIIMQISWIGSAPAEDSGAAEGRSCLRSRGRAGGGGEGLGLETGLAPATGHPGGAAGDWGAGAGGGGRAGWGSQRPWRGWDLRTHAFWTLFVRGALL